VANPKKAVKQARLDERAQAIQRQHDIELRTRNFIIIGFAVLIVGGSALLYFLVNPPDFSGKKPAPAANLSAAYSVPEEGHDHIPNCVPAYKHRPPSSGCHASSTSAPRPWQAFNDPVPATDWVHNLEHGGIVLLYKCSGTECADLYSQAFNLFAQLPAHAEPVHPAAGQQQVQEVKFLSTPYQDMETKFAVLAWTKELDMNTLDAATIKAFYETYVDHGREDVP
jgi:hypothetical protein